MIINSLVRLNSIKSQSLSLQRFFKWSDLNELRGIVICKIALFSLNIIEINFRAICTKCIIKC